MKSMTLNPFTVLPSPDFVQAAVLSSGVAQAFDVPTGAAYCALSFNADVWVRYGSTAAVVPSASSTAATNSELNPTVRCIQSTVATTGISVYSDSPAKGNIAWYKA